MLYNMMPAGLVEVATGYTAVADDFEVLDVAFDMLPKVVDDPS
jgi:hypothetical protein